MVGLAGEGQSFDGNGLYVRFQTGGGDHIRLDRRRGGGPTRRALYGNAARARRSARARAPRRKRAAVQARTSACYKQTRSPEPQRPGRRRARAPATRLGERQ